MKWEEYSIDKLCIKVTDGAHFSPQELPGGYPMASSKDMSENDFDFSNVKTISEQDYIKLVAADCKPLLGDVLLIKDGNSYLKNIFQVKIERDLVVLSSIAILRPKKERISPLFFQYALRNPDTKKQMENFVSGAAIPRIVLKDFKQMKVSIPPLPTQQKIASILSAYDDLIENNLKRIRLLEEAAQHLYREWFVRFRFPGWEEVKVVDGLPEGWEMGTVGQICKVKSGYAFKSKDWQPTGNRVIKITNIGNHTVDTLNCDCVDESIAKIAKKFELFTGEMVIAMTGATVGKVGLIPRIENPIFLNQRVGVFKSNSETQKFTAFLFTFFMSDDAQRKVLNLAQGAAQPNISTSQIENIEIVISTENVLVEFCRLANPFLDQFHILHYSNQKLKEARDILLPRLMNQTLKV